MDELMSDIKTKFKQPLADPSVTHLADISRSFAHAKTLVKWILLGLRDMAR